MPPSGKKRGSGWLIFPFIAIIILVIIRFVINKPSTSSEGSEQVSSREQASSAANRHADTQPNYSTITVFSPDAIIDMVDRNEDYIAGVCKKNEFSYSAVSENSIYKYRNYYPGNVDIIRELITTWRDFPNRMNYSIHYENAYNYFISEINKLNPVPLKKDQYDKDYPDSSHLLIKDCVFIPIGFKKDYDGYCIVAIRKDKVNSVGNLAKKSDHEADSKNNNFMLEEIRYSFCNMKANNTKIYFAPDITRKKEGFLNTVDNVYTRAEKNGFCDIIYERNGSVDSAWVLKDDVFCDEARRTEYNKVKFEQEVRKEAERERNSQ